MYGHLTERTMNAMRDTPFPIMNLAVALRFTSENKVALEMPNGDRGQQGALRGRKNPKPSMSF